MVKEQLVKCGAIPVSLELLKAKEPNLLLVAAQVLCYLSGVPEYVVILVDKGAIPILVQLWEESNDAEVGQSSRVKQFKGHFSWSFCDMIKGNESHVGNVQF